MKSQIRTVILFFLTAVFAVSAFMLVAPNDELPCRR